MQRRLRGLHQLSETRRRLPLHPKAHQFRADARRNREPCRGAPPKQRPARTPDEIASLAVAHLQSSALPVASFGQGCEGEPLLQTPLLLEAIAAIRAGTKR